MEQQEEHHPHTVVQHWVSVGDVIVLIASVVTTVAGLAFTYGGLARDVNALSNQVKELSEQQRQMTPPAAQAIASIQATDQALGRDIERLQAADLELRREVRDALERIEAKLDNHDRAIR